MQPDDLPATLPAGTTLSCHARDNPGDAGGSANVVGAGTGTITATASGKLIPVYLAVAFISGHLTEAEVVIINPIQPVPADLFASLGTAVAGRAAQG